MTHLGEFDKAGNEQKMEPLSFTLRGQVFLVVPEMTMADRHTYRQEILKNGGLSTQEWFERALLNDEEVARFLTVTSEDRENPVPNSVLDEIREAITAAWTGEVNPKETGS